MYQEEKNTSVNPIVLFITGVLSIVLTVAFFIQVFGSANAKKNTSIDLNVDYVTSATWAKCKTIKVTNEDSAIKSYSFDGTNYQESNTYEVCSNGLVTVKAKNSKDKEIGTGSITVTGIDNITPTIIVKDITVKIGDTVDLLDSVVAVDNESGISGSIKVEPNEIDTKASGTFTFVYTVNDKAGNTGTRNRKITVE